MENIAWKSLVCPVVYSYRQGTPGGEVFRYILRRKPILETETKYTISSTWAQAKKVQGRFPHCLLERALQGGGSPGTTSHYMSLGFFLKFEHMQIIDIK